MHQDKQEEPIQASPETKIREAIYEILVNRNKAGDGAFRLTIDAQVEGNKVTFDNQLLVKLP